MPTRGPAARPRRRATRHPARGTRASPAAGLGGHARDAPGPWRQCPRRPRPRRPRPRRARAHRISGMAALDFDRFDVLTFDCYGTLIDWEAGILAALHAPLAAHGIE